MATNEGARQDLTDVPFTVSGVVLLLAIGGSLLAGVAVLGEGMGLRSKFLGEGAFDQAYLLLPHTAILCLALAGLRRSAALASLAIGGVCAFYVSFMALMTLEPSLGWFAIFQIVLVGAALPELREWRTRFFTVRLRLLGFATGLGAWWLCAALLVSVGAARRTAAQSRQANVQRAAGQQAMLWTTRSNLQILSAVAGCVEMFRGVEVGGLYPDSIAQVKGWSQQTELGGRGCRNLLYEMKPDSTGALSGDYKRIWYSPTTATPDPFRSGGFQLEVEANWGDVHEPVPRDMPGTRSFLLDSAGNVHVTAERRRATLADPLVPRCLPRDADNAQCLRWTPRQRWGLHDVLPSGHVYIAAESAEAGRPTPFRLGFHNQRPLDSIRVATVDWGDGREVTRLTPIGEKSYTNKPGGLDFLLMQTFTDTGTRVVRATVTTAEGATYESADTFRVYIRAASPVVIPMIALPTQHGVDDAGRLLAGAEAQTRQALQNVAKAAAEAGTSMDRIERCDLMIPGEQETRAVTLAYRAAFAGKRAPPSTLMASNNLLIGQHVQIKCFAATQAAPSP